jgi:hypothetical protein
LSSPVPAERAASRFRLPVEPPTRQLLIASLAAIAGACQLLAWALARLPWFFLVLGFVLMAIGVGTALAALGRHYQLRWVAYVDPAAFSVARGRSREVFPWRDVAAVSYDDFRVQLVATDGRRLCTLPVDRTRAAHTAATQLRRAVQAQLDSSADR